MHVCKIYLLFISADAAKEKEKEKREESAAAHWCFKVCRPHSIYAMCLYLNSIRAMV
jgi:hypothetical protein